MTATDTTGDAGTGNAVAGVALVGSAERVDNGFEVEAIRIKLAKIADRAANRRRTRKLKAA